MVVVLLDELGIIFGMAISRLFFHFEMALAFWDNFGVIRRQSGIILPTFGGLCHEIIFSTRVIC